MALINLDETLALVEKQGSKLSLLGSEGRSIYGGQLDTPGGEHFTPALGYHALSIVPGGPIRTDIESGLLRPRGGRTAPEDLVFIPSGNAFTIGLPNGKYLAGRNQPDARAFALLFPTHLLQSKFEDLTGREVDPSKIMQGLVSHPSQQFRDIGRAIRIEVFADKCGRSSMLDALTDVLFLELARIYEEAKRDFAPVRRLSTQHHKLVEAMMLRARDGTTSMRMIADALAMSPTKFTKRFRASFGMTPTEYVAALRLDKAKALLEQPDLSLADIAYDCGFSSQAHFTTRFSQAFGTPPGRYRSDILVEAAVSERHATKEERPAR